MLQAGQQKFETKQKQGMNPVVAGLAGVIAGAAGVTAVALADKDIRKKVIKRTKDATTTLQKWSADKLHDTQDESDIMDKPVEEEEKKQMQEEKLPEK